MAIIQTLKKGMFRNKTSQVVADGNEKREAGSTTSQKTISAEDKKAANAVVIGTRVTEKTTGLIGARIYTFTVQPDSTKRAVKQAVERLYGVNVLGVRMVHIPRKRRMRGRMAGWKKAVKKALVKIKEGQTIEPANS